MTRHQWRVRVHKFWALLDQESIILNQMVFYVLISLYGLLSLWEVLGSQDIGLATTPAYYIAWMWLCFAAPLVTIVGKALPKELGYAGMILQLVGDSATWLIFITYITAIAQNESWLRNGFGVTMCIACLMGTPLFILRDVRRMMQVEVIVKMDELT